MKRKLLLSTAIHMTWYGVILSSMPAHAQQDAIDRCESNREMSECVESFHEGMAAVMTGKRSDQAGLWGFIDPAGQMVITPAYSQVREFSNGLAAAQTDKGWGFIDKQGRWAIPPQFSETNEFNQNGTALATRDDRTILIDRSGKVLKTFPVGVQPASFYSTYFSYTLMKVEQGVYLSNSKSGQHLALPADVGKVEFPQDGLVPAWRRKSNELGNWGYLDNHGKQWVVAPGILQGQTIPVQLEMKPLHYHGIFAFNHDSNQWTFVDATGKRLNNATYENVEILSPGIWAVNKGENYQLLDDKLEVLLSWSFGSDVVKADMFGDWLPVTTKTHLLLFGPGGNLKKIPAAGVSIENKNNHLWVWEKKAKKTNGGTYEEEGDKQLIQIFNLQGLPLLDPVTVKKLRQYDVKMVERREATTQPTHPSLPIAVLTSHDKRLSGILTPEGKIVVNSQWSEIFPDEGDFLLVKVKSGLLGAINVHGNWTIMPGYDRIDGFAGGLSFALPHGTARGEEIWIDEQGKHMPTVPQYVLDNHRGTRESAGILAFNHSEDDNEDETIHLWDIRGGHELAEKLDDIESFDNGFALAKQGNLWGMLDRHGQWAIHPGVESPSDIKRFDNDVFLISHTKQYKSNGITEDETMYRLFSIGGQELTGDLVSEPKAVEGGYYLVHLANGQMALIDLDGKTLLSWPFISNEDKIQNGWILSSLEAREGLIDATGAWVLEPRYQSLEALGESENQLAISDGKQSWLIDAQGHKQLDGVQGKPLAGLGLLAVTDENKQGTRLLDFQGQQVAHLEKNYTLNTGMVSEGLIAFTLRHHGEQMEKSGFMDTHGKKVIGAHYDNLGIMINGRAMASQSNKSGPAVGYIDRTGRFVVTPEFDWGKNFADERALVAKNSIVQFINREGKTQVSFGIQCDSIVVRDANGKQTWPLQPLSCPADKQETTMEKNQKDAS